MTDARIGYGSVMEYSTNSGGAWTEVAEVFDISPPNSSEDSVEATHFGSPSRTREFIQGLSAPGECSFEMNFVPGSVADQAVQAWKGAGTIMFRITFPNSVIWTFSGHRTGYEPAVPVDDRMTATVTLALTGSYSVTPAAAPTNTTLPAVSGVAQEGEVVTALTGVWTGAPTFTYVWQELITATWTAISGATTSTLTVPGGSTIGRPIRVVVTGTNAGGSASANSVQTADVIAA